MKNRIIFKSSLILTTIFFLAALPGITQTPTLRVSTRSAQTLLARIETKTVALDREVQRTNTWNNSNVRTERLSDLVSDLQLATSTFRTRFISRQPVGSEVDDLLNKGLLINAFVNRNRVTGRIATQWASLRTDLSTLARYYGMTWNWNQAVTTPPVYPPYTSTDAQLRNLITQLESKTNVYKRQMDSSLDRSRWNNTNTEDSINAYITRFEEATDRLKNGFNSRSSTGEDATAVLSSGRYIDRFMAINRMSRASKNQWTSIKKDLDTLASYYRLSWNWNEPFEPTPGYPVYTGTDAELRTLITNIEDKTNVFKRRLDNSLDRSVLDGTQAEDSMNSYLAAFEDATNRLKDGFNSRRSTAADATEVLNRARYVDGFMARYNLSRGAENQWTELRTDLNILASYYRVSWNWNEPVNTNIDMALTGTYQLNTGRSDNVDNIITAALRNFPVARRDNVKRNLERRLESPQMIAIDKRNRTVMLASSNSPQVTFVADGIVKSETNRGRTVKTTATATSGGISIEYEGDRMNDFYVMFSPVGTRQMKVTRRVYLENKNESVTVSSIYDKIDTTAQWSTVNNGTAGNYTGVNDFYVPDGTRITARLRGTVNTKDSQPDDRFAMEVTSPNQYRGAIIEGRVTEAENSGRLLGRANISMSFDTLRINGRTYRFGGIVESVNTANGDTVSVTNEGTVRDSSQTTQTATRAGIGAVLGAIIGAIADGGQGAAIGAGVGAGAGAGSVLITGRDSIELGPGSTFGITATAPTNVSSTRN